MSEIIIPNEAEQFIEQISKFEIRNYSTYEFGRKQDSNNKSFIIEKAKAEENIFKLKSLMPKGVVCFIGTSNWLGGEKNEGVEVVIGEGNSETDILFLSRTMAPNYDLTTNDIIRKFTAWEKIFGISIFQAETDCIGVEFHKLPNSEDLSYFAEMLYDFCSDMVDQGVGSLDVLKQDFVKTKRLYFWWD